MKKPAAEASSSVKKWVAERGIKVTKISAKTVSFAGFGYGDKVIVTVEGWTPNPIATDLETFAKSSGFMVMFVTTQGVHA